MADTGNNNNNGYQSGGKGFVSPNQAIEAATYREFMNQAGGKNGVANADQAEIANILQTMLERMASETKIANEELSKMVSAVRDAVMNAPNQQQGAKDGMSQLNKLVATDLNLMQGLEKQKTTSSAEKSALGAVNSSPIKQLIQINQGILKTVLDIGRHLGALEEKTERLGDTLIEIDTGNDKKDNKEHQEEIDEFEGLRQTIAHGLVNSPTATKLGQLGASLMSLGLMKIAGNKNLPDWARKTAAAAVYLQVPQTLMNIIGMVVSQALSKWLVSGAGKILGNTIGLLGKGIMGLFGGFISTLGSLLSALLPIAIPLAVVALLGAGIFALFKGIKDHKEKMKQKDAEIDNDPNLTAFQKDRKKLGNHMKSGAGVGAKSGALAGAAGGVAMGAAIGSVIPGVGTAIGAAVGGVAGAIAGSGLGATIGAAIGGLKPGFTMIGHGIKTLGGHFANGIKNMGSHIKNGLSAVGGKIVQGTKWAAEHKDQLKAILKPIGAVLQTILTLASPFFLLFKMFANSIMKSKLLQKILGLSDKTSDNTDNHKMTLGEKIKSSWNTAKNYLTPTGDKSGLVNMKDLGLKGKIDSDNSVPKTLAKNAKNIQQLDYFLNKWGYDVTYTSNMGGQHQAGEKSHASGNKVDLQLMKNGKVAHMTDEQLNFLKSLGYWGNGTGALGWEPVSGQVGGGHYDMHNGGYVKMSSEFEQLMDLQKKAEEEAQKKKEEEARKKEQAEKAKQAVKKTVEALPGGKTLIAGAKAIAKTAQDITGMNDYTERQNVTNATVNVGSK